MTEDTFLSPAQVCKALGLTAKALRLYERRGLIQPHRSEAGWRVFGPADVARLHQIGTLKHLGLTLEKIGEMLEGRLADLDCFLELQMATLTQQARRIERAQALIRRAQALLARGEPLSIADIVILSQESAMPQSDWHKIAQPFYDRHLTDEDRRIPGEVLNARWQELFTQANRLHAANTDPVSDEVIDLARQWMNYVELFTGENQELRSKYYAAYDDALGDPDTAPHLPISREVLDFLRPAFGRVQAQRRTDPDAYKRAGG